MQRLGNKIAAMYELTSALFSQGFSSLMNFPNEIPLVQLYPDVMYEHIINAIYLNSHKTFKSNHYELPRITYRCQ